MRHWPIILFGIALALGLFLRVPHLGERPMHNDEAVNGIKVAHLLDTGEYRYDPDEHHGPTLYYFSAWVFRLAGLNRGVEITEAHLRVVAILFGAGLLLLLPLTRDALGARGTAWAGLFLAVSPAMVFYSRYYIHELILVFFAGLALAGGWRYWRSRRVGWAILAGGAVGFMDATKETFIISLVAGGLALATNQAWNRWVDASGAPAKPTRPRNWPILAAVAAWGVVAVVFFTSFFTNASGPLDSIRSYMPWLNRAGGDSPHIHPWSFYFERLLYFRPEGKGIAWTEVFLVLLAGVGTWAGFARKKLGNANASFVRFLALYTFAQISAYTFISYKTPWCLLNFWHPLILLAGLGAAVIVRAAGRQPRTWVARALIMVGVGHLAWQSWLLCGKYAADQRNPYVYAHTSPHLQNLLLRVRQLAEISPQRWDTLVKVAAPNSDYWPLPWHLRQFHHVGYYDSLPADPYAPIMIVSSQFNAQLDEARTHLMVGYFQLRPGVFLELYVQLDLWTAWLKAFPPPKDPADDE